LLVVGALCLLLAVRCHFVLAGYLLLVASATLFALANLLTGS
jgi:hypothetical protein